MNAPTDIRAAQRVKGNIDAGWFTRADEAVKGCALDVDRRRTQPGDEIVLSRRGGAIGPCPGKLKELQQRSPDAAARARDKRALAPFHLRDAMDHLPRADIVEDYGGGLHVGHLVRNRYEMPGAPHQIFGEAAMDGECGDALTDAKAGHAVSDRLDAAGDFIAADHGQFWRECVVSAEHGEVCGADAAGGDAHAQFAGAGLVERQLDRGQHLGPTGSGDHHRAIGSHHHVPPSDGFDGKDHDGAGD